MDEILKRLDALEKKSNNKRIYQEDITPDAIKARHIGEGVRFIRSGLEANRPTAETPQAGQPCYFATDTNKLYIYNGTAWKSVTLS